MRRIIFAGPWWHEDLMQGVARHCGARGWHLNLDPALSGQLPDDWQGDGILTTIGDGPGRFERFRRQADCPAVALSLNAPQIDIPRVGFDNWAVGRLAAEHFLERGFTSFAFYDRSRQHSAEQRRDAFAASVEPRCTGAFRTILPDPSGRWAARQQDLATQLSRLPRPLAVLAADDASGVEVIEACQSLGLDIPYDVGVLGMLDMPLFRESTTIGMSSIRVDFDRNTRVACEVLESMMAGGAAPAEPILFPPTGIAVRASTDVIAAQHPGVARAVRFMMRHYAEPIDVPAIIAASGMSQTRLFAAFKAELGEPPGASLIRVRVDKAKRQLEQTRDKLDVVAADCGFGSRLNLYRQFTRRVGMSPGAWRKQSREADEAREAD